MYRRQKKASIFYLHSACVLVFSDCSVFSEGRFVYNVYSVLCDVADKISHQITIAIVAAVRGAGARAWLRTLRRAASSCHHHNFAIPCAAAAVPATRPRQTFLLGLHSELRRGKGSLS